MYVKHFLKRNKKINTWALLVAGGAGLLAIGIWIGYVSKSVPAAAQAIRENTTAYKFVHPLLAVGRPDISTPSPIYAPLAKSVNAYIASEKNSGAISDASIYYINYNTKNAGSFAINESAAYQPASLLKVVIMVAYFNLADSDSSILAKPLTYTNDIAAQEASVPFEDPSTLSAGATYSTEELIEKMIINSDNGAMNTLLANMNPAYLNDVYTELGLHGPGNDFSYMISTKDYALFFRILYNGTYLSPEFSEKALSLLSKATFKDGLVAGLPSGTVVAHKFGEHVNGTGTKIDSVELHDCGLVYPTNDPYLLCVMTKGKSLDSLKGFISTVSKMVYQTVSK
jgi:beta-lactamase class A